jgi:hypothetical protein
MIGQCAGIKDINKKNRCVWIDAIRSTEIHCGTDIAESVVKQVFQNCVNDETPFK